VNYNSELYLKGCLDSIIKFTKNIDYEIIVVDNNSISREMEKFPEIYPQVKFFFSKENRGFGSGCNYGIKHSTGKFIAVVNPDIIINDNVFLSLFKIMEKYPEIGLCSPSFVNENGELTFTYNNFPNYRWEFLEFLGMDGTAKETKRLLSVLKEVKEKTIPFVVDTVTGACMFIRASVLKKIGDFDKNMFLYYEDTDLQKRITEAGFKIACIPELRVVHLENKSTKGGGDDSLFYINLYRSKLIYMKKHMNFIKRNIFRLMHIISFFIRTITLAFRVKDKKNRHVKLSLYKKILRIYLFNYSI